MKLLFVMRHSGFVRNFEWVLRELAQRGHQVHLGFELYRPTAEVADRIGADHPEVTYDYVPLRRDRWADLALAVRQSVDYLRYLNPAYADATKLRARAERSAPTILVRLTRARWFRRPGVLRAVNRLLLTAERHIPVSTQILGHVAEGGYDAVLVTPLVAGYSQHDWVRSAHLQGLPSILPVASWDNLTNKGLVHEPPDRIYVWNEIQCDEAEEFHHVPRDRVLAVGAHTYDHWFAWQPSRDREEFFHAVGLDPERPVLLYVCSSSFIARDERPIVEKWLGAVRGQPELRDVQVIVRPHPSKGGIWSDWSRGDPGVVVWPPAGADPLNPQARADYFDSLHYSTAVVGVNTSALIEAAIVGRRTYTFLLPELRETQEGTLHFHYLVRENGGPLVVGHDLDEHTALLAEALAEPPDPTWNRAFLERFVRPHGLDTAGAPLLADDLERLVAAGARAPQPRRWTAGTALLAPLALLYRLYLKAGGDAEVRWPDGADRPARTVRKRKPLRKRLKRAGRRGARRSAWAAVRAAAAAARIVLPEAAREHAKGRLRGRVRFLPAQEQADAEQTGGRAGR
jgi:hypothetical protein